MKPEIVYAIRVMTTKDKKERKRKAWAWCYRHGGRIVWGVTDGPLALCIQNICQDDQVLWSNRHANLKLPGAEAALGCKCKVVTIELTERSGDAEN